MLHHIHTAAHGGMVTPGDGLSRGVALLDDKTVETGAIDEAVGIAGLVGVADEALRSKPYHMIRVAGEAGVELLLRVVPLKGRLHAAVVVAGEDGGVLEVVVHEGVGGCLTECA